MKIRRMFATFAGLNESRLELEPGLNIIEGANESGKSTWCAFLRAMLYGIPTRERDTKERPAEKNLYRPWSGAPISGRLELEADGREITVERSGTDSAPLRSLRAYTSGGGDAGLTAENIGEKLTGASREVFERSAFVSSPPLPSGSAELEARILATVSSGDESANASAAEARLREWQRRLRYNRRGEIPELEGEINALRREADECRETADLIDSFEAELREASAREKELEDLLKRMGSAESAAARKELAAAKERLENIERELRNIEENVLPEGCPSTGELRSLEGRVTAERDAAAARLGGLDAELSELDRRIFAAVDRAQHAHGALPNAETLAGRATAAERDLAEARRLEASASDRTPRRFAILAALLGLAAVCCFVSVLFVRSNAPIFCGAAAAVCCLVFAVLARESTRKRKLSRASLEELLRGWGADSPDALREFVEDTRSAEIRRAECAGRAAGLEGEPSPAEDELEALTGERGQPLDALRTLISWSEKRDALQVGAREARAAIDALKSSVLAKSAGESEEDVPEAEVFSGVTREDADAELKSLRLGISGLRSDIARAEGHLGGRDAAIIDEKRGRLEERLAELERRFRAIDTALEALRRAGDELRSRFSPALGKETARILGELTGGRYDRVAVSREFKPEAGREASPLRSGAQLSRGTSDQLWFALRLAVAHTVLPDDTPLILDDAFVTFDDGRLEEALRLLEREAETRQILLFTCHSREAGMCAGREKVNIIRL